MSDCSAIGCHDWRCADCKKQPVPAEVLAVNERLVMERNKWRRRAQENATEVYRLEGILARKPNDLENEIAELRARLEAKGAEFIRMENAWRREVDKVRREYGP